MLNQSNMPCHYAPLAYGVFQGHHLLTGEMA